MAAGRRGACATARRKASSTISSESPDPVVIRPANESSGLNSNAADRLPRGTRNAPEPAEVP
jgi:hypothetical protein